MVDNLFLILMELCGGRYLTADYLAGKIGVSKRTIYRYMDTLSLCNIPLLARQGNSGGYKIGDEYLIPNSYFTAEEMSLIESSLSSLALTVSPRAVENILSKLRITARKSANPVATHSLIAYDNNTYSQHQGKMIALERAITSRSLVSIKYHGRKGDVATRIIAPLNFISRDSEWYIYCYCYMRDGYRTFKITRISHIDIRDDKHNIPDDYPRTWQFSDNDTPNLQLVLEVGKAARYLVEEWLGLESIAMHNDKLIASACVKDDEETISKLLSLGLDVTIVSPSSMALTVKSRVEALYSHYRLETID